MSRQIRKYALSTNLRTTTLELPAGAIFRHFGHINTVLHVWFEVDTEIEKKEQHRISVICTGDYWDIHRTYLGTIILPDTTVLHLYDSVHPEAGRGGTEPSGSDSLDTGSSWKNFVSSS